MQGRGLPQPPPRAFLCLPASPMPTTPQAGASSPPVRRDLHPINSNSLLNGLCWVTLVHPNEQHPPVCFCWAGSQKHIQTSSPGGLPSKAQGQVGADFGEIPKSRPGASNVGTGLESSRTWLSVCAHPTQMAALPTPACAQLCPGHATRMLPATLGHVSHLRKVTKMSPA